MHLLPDARGRGDKVSLAGVSAAAQCRVPKPVLRPYVVHTQQRVTAASDERREQSTLLELLILERPAQQPDDD